MFPFGGRLPTAVPTEAVRQFVQTGRPSAVLSGVAPARPRPRLCPPPPVLLSSPASPHPPHPLLSRLLPLSVPRPCPTSSPLPPLLPCLQASLASPPPLPPLSPLLACLLSSPVSPPHLPPLLPVPAPFGLSSPLPSVSRSPPPGLQGSKSIFADGIVCSFNFAAFCSGSVIPLRRQQLLKGLSVGWIYFGTKVSKLLSFARSDRCFISERLRRVMSLFLRGSAGREKVMNVVGSLG